MVSAKIRKMIEGVVKEPGSVNARAGLARLLEKFGHPDAEKAWAMAIRISASKGDFFGALVMARFYLKEEQTRLLGELASIFAKGQKGPVSLLTDAPAPVLRDCETQEEWIALAAEVGCTPVGVAEPMDFQESTLPIFESLKPETFVALASKIQPVTLEVGTVLVHQDEREQTLYLLTHGSVKVVQSRGIKEPIQLAVVQAPTLIGEMSLFNSTPRRASVISQEQGLAWKITARLLVELTQLHPELSIQLRKLIELRQLNNLMKASKIFREVGDRERLLQSFVLRDVEIDEVIFPQGSPPPGLFIILHGEALLSIEKDGETREVKKLHEGDAFGEISLLTGEKTTGSIRMPDGGILLSMTPETFHTLHGSIPGLELELKRLMKIRKKNDLFIPLGDRYKHSELDMAWLLGDDFHKE